MTSHAQIEANRINSLSSTGPRTPEGKAISSRNSISHGLSSIGDPVLPHEDREEFKIVTRSYAIEFSPCGSHETYLIDEMVGARWRIARADRLMNIILSAFAAGQSEPIGDDPETRIARQIAAKGDPIAKLERHRATWERAYYRCIRELRASQVGQVGYLRAIGNRPLESKTEPAIAPEPPPQRSEPNPGDTKSGDTKSGDAKPYVRPAPKIGRNDYCPCGSGLKYKKCCLDKICVTPPAAA